MNQLGLIHYLNRTKQAMPSKAIARIFSEHKTGWDLLSTEGPVRGILLNSIRQRMAQSQLPKVGDWVEFVMVPKEHKAQITKVLPRYSALTRRLEKKRIDQTIATNIDIMFVVISIDQDFNALQLNRYLAIAQESKITPVVVINKTDKKTSVQSSYYKIRQTILDVHPKLKVITTSATSKQGLVELESQIKTDQTAVLVGNSGVGKSSLVNVILSGAKQATKEVSSTGKGRHTTTSRQMFILPNGGIVIDTPGMRTLELDVTAETNSAVFTQLDELSRQCKYRNCDHIKSAGCALRTAVAKKLITSSQLDQFLNITQARSAKINYNKSRN